MKGITIETSCEKNDDECVKANVHPITLWNINELKLHKVKEYSPEKIIALRKKAGLSQAALAKVFNISSSAVQQWEVGNKRPSGASKKLYDLIERKGLEALI